MKRIILVLTILPVFLYSQNNSELNPNDFKDTLILKSGEIFVCNINENKHEIIKKTKLNCNYITEEGYLGLRQVPKSIIEEIKDWRYDKAFLTQYKQTEKIILSYQGVVKVEGANKNQLYLRGRKWFFESFKESEEVLEISDKESGELAGKGTFKVYFGNYDGGYVRYDIILEIKESRYRFTFKDFKHTFSQHNYGHGLITNDKYCPYESLTKTYGKKLANKNWQQIKVDIEENVYYQIVSILRFMEQYENDEDW
ncbi:MAG: DUF4468 domain-containing protein [Bacteroidales bacterium]|nr:DUF4468 domain-containing protein [Bacteroidales bacterium]